MDDAGIAGGGPAATVADSDSRVLGHVRKFRAAGMEQPVAEAVAEELAHLPTRAEVREDIKSAIDGLEERMTLKMRAMIAEAMEKHHQKMVVLVLAGNGLTVALMTFVFSFLK